MLSEKSHRDADGSSEKYPFALGVGRRIIGDIGSIKTLALHCLSSVIT
jgi:hypothetical protein